MGVSGDVAITATTSERLTQESTYGEIVSAKSKEVKMNPCAAITPLPPVASTN